MSCLKCSLLIIETKEVLSVTFNISKVYVFKLNVLNHR